MLAFVVPLVHPAAARNWKSISARLNETLRSLAACCRDNEALCVLVANDSAALPTVPGSIQVVRVSLDPPEGSVFVGDRPESERRAVKQFDKGTKVLHGAIHAIDRGATYLMTVDADDLVSRRLPAFVRNGLGKPGWFVEKGWVLPVGGRIAFLQDAFVETCGTSLIVRADLLRLPSSPSDLPSHLLRRWFGSHKYLRDDLASEGHMLTALPFPGAVYRTGHPENNTGKGGIRETYFPRRIVLRRPFEFAHRLQRLRYFGRTRLEEFADGRPLE